MTPQLRAVARRQAGAFTRKQALSCGMDAAGIDWYLLDGEWLLLHPNVMVCAGTPNSEQLRNWAALLAVGGRVVLAGLSGARRFGLEQVPEPPRPQLAIPNDRDLGDIAGVDITRVVPHRWRVVWRGGMPLRPLGETIRDVAGRVPFDTARDIVQHALRRRRISENALLAELGRGLRGSAALRAVLEEVAPGYQVKWERILHRALLKAGIVMEPQVKVEATGGRTAYVDLGIRRLRFGIEIDGFLNHMARFKADRQRGRRLCMELDWTIVSVAVEEIATNLDAVVAEIVAYVRRLERTVA